MDQIKYIGICLSTIHEEDRFSLVEELNKHITPHGYRLIVFNSCADLYESSTIANNGTASVFRLVPYDMLSAMIVMPNIMYDDSLVDEVVRNCRTNDIPVISMDREIEGCITCSFNNSDIFEEMCRHVIEYHGARNVMLMAGFKNNVYSEERIEAFKHVLAENNIPFDEENVGYGCFWELPTLEVLQKWFVEENRPIPDAIICANDFMAITVSGFLQDMGVKIPDDCIVTGFDGIKQTEYLPPNITTCKQDFEQMGELITDLILRMEQGEQISGHFKVDFNMILSQSCGCCDPTLKNVRSSIQSLINSLRFSDERQKMICNAHTSVPKITDINYLPRILMNRFKIDTCVCALNDGIFDPPDFGDFYKGERAFSEEMHIVYHRYDRSEYERCVIPKERLIPRYDLMFKGTDPVIVCCANFSEMVMGYCVFRPAIDIDEYEKLQSLMSTMGACLGTFHSRMQIRNINRELHKLSQRDFMTGLFNRRGFFEMLDNRLKDDSSNGLTLVIISTDLDGLKYINDSFGHNEGDNAIITVGRALLASSFYGEICARFGGDEFCTAAIVPTEEAELFYEEFKYRFLDYLYDYNRKSDKPYVVKASIGCCSEVITGDIDPMKLLNSADEKMYEYKQSHKKQKNDG